MNEVMELVYLLELWVGICHFHLHSPFFNARMKWYIHEINLLHSTRNFSQIQIC